MEIVDWAVLVFTLIFIVVYGTYKTQGSTSAEEGFYDGMGFVQFYFGLPIAMVIISLVFIPLYHKLKVFTAYEYLESRFDLKTRSLTAILFLIQRSLAAGITIYAPAIILSAVLGWNLTLLNIIIGIIVIIYTVSGGTKAVRIIGIQYGQVY